MRNMRFNETTYCLTIANNGEFVTIGSSDKYVFCSHEKDSNAELYLFKFYDGRTTLQKQRYQLHVIALADCGGSVYTYLETNDILLGVSSNEGCIPYLYLLRPVFQRGGENTLTNNRGCR